MAAHCEQYLGEGGGEKCLVQMLNDADHVIFLGSLIPNPEAGMRMQCGCRRALTLCIHQWRHWGEAAAYNVCTLLKAYKWFGSWLLLLCLSHSLGRHRTPSNRQGEPMQVVTGLWPALEACDWLPCCSSSLALPFCKNVCCKVCGIPALCTLFSFSPWHGEAVLTTSCRNMP